MLKPLGEHGAGEPGRTLEDFAECLTAQMQVADDQRRPTFSKDLRTTGDGTVLAVGPHQRSVPRGPTCVKSRFLTSKSRWVPSLRCRPDVAMSASTTGGTMAAPTVMQIPGFRGVLIPPDHHGYDDARALWNGTVDRRPRLIARCDGTADVAAAVRFARHFDLEIAVRGGGHNVAGTAVCEDGVVIDLSAMRAVSVDPLDRTALVQGGALWSDVTTRPRHTVWRPPAASSATPASEDSAWAAASGGSCGSTASPSTISWRPRWSPRTARSCGPRPTTTPTSFGHSEAAAGTSASSARSGSRCTRSAPPSWPGRSSGRQRTPPTSCASTGTSSPTRPTSSDGHPARHRPATAGRRRRGRTSGQPSR